MSARRRVQRPPWDTWSPVPPPGLAFASTDCRSGRRAAQAASRRIAGVPGRGGLDRLWPRGHISSAQHRRLEQAPGSVGGLSPRRSQRLRWRPPVHGSRAPVPKTAGPVQPGSSTNRPLLSALRGPPPQYHGRAGTLSNGACHGRAAHPRIPHRHRGRHTHRPAPGRGEGGDVRGGQRQVTQVLSLAAQAARQLIVGLLEALDVVDLDEDDDEQAGRG